MLRGVWKFVTRPTVSHLVSMLVFAWITTDTGVWYVTRLLALLIVIDDVIFFSRPKKSLALALS